MKGLITTIIILLKVGECFSQELEIELIARPALTSLRGNEIIKDNYDPKINLSTGVAINYFIKDNSIVNFGILYDKKGGSNTSNVVIMDEQGEIIDEGTLTTESNFHYVTIPIQWGKRFGQRIKWQFGCGLYGSFLIKQELIGTGIANSNEDNTEKFKKFDFGLSASFNSYIPINEKLLVKIGLDDLIGLANVSDVPVANDGTIMHNSLGLSVGLNIKLN